MYKMIFLFSFMFLFTLSLVARGVTPDWIKRYDDVLVAMALDNSGDIYVSVSKAMIKYSTTGNILWTKNYDLLFYPWDIALDDSDNVYVTGYWGNDWNYNFATCKYSSDGDSVWCKYYEPTSYGGHANDIAVDHSGHVYVTGGRYYDSTSYDIVTIKYDADSGSTAWIARYGNPLRTIDRGVAVTVDQDENVYVLGFFDPDTSVTFFDNMVTIRYHPNGDTAWVRSYNGVGNGLVSPRAIATDDSGNVYVIGSTISTMVEYVIIKYDSSGNTTWISTYAGGIVNTAEAISLDRFYNVYVTGTSYSSITGNDYVTVKYSANGDTAWTRRYSSGSNTTSNDLARSIAVDDSGNIYITGESFNPATNYDYATVKHDSLGKLIWETRYNGAANGNDGSRIIKVDDSSNVYVAGDSYGGANEYDFDCTIIKYIQPSPKHGDANGDGKITVSDVVYVINYLFKGGPAPNPLSNGDANCDGKVSVTDVVYLINYLFKGGPPPAC